MLTTKVEAPSYGLLEVDELSRLLTAAVVNQEFRQLLLTNSSMALVHGYNGESFNFSDDSQVLIKSIHANSLADFANQIIFHGNGNNNSNGRRNGSNRNGIPHHNSNQYLLQRS